MEKNSQNTESFMQHRLREGGGMLLLFVALIIVLSLVSHAPTDPSFSNATPSAVVQNYGGRIGALLSSMLLEKFGLGSFVLPLAMGAYACLMMLHKRLPNNWLLTTIIPVLLVTLGVLFHLWQPLPAWPSINGIGNGGLVGMFAAILMLKWVGGFGTVSLSAVLTLLGGMWLLGLTLEDLYKGGCWLTVKVRYYSLVLWRWLERIRFRQANQFDLPLMPRAIVTPKTKAVVEKPKVEAKKAPKSKEKAHQDVLPLSLEGEYMMPGLNFLDENPQPKDAGEKESALQQNARLIEQQLANFGVKGQIVKICPGPVITIYELEPEAGVRTSQVVNLADDLARAMAAQSIRVAPIPGRSVIGIEMPNQKRKMVVLKDLLENEAFETDHGKLTVALGVSSSGEVTFADLAKWPHALIAGTTGSGKSVAMNVFILSLLYRMGPDELKFVMIDPKMLELSTYNDIPHLLHPVITDPGKASAALKWVVNEMESRYLLMSEMGVRNIANFNAKFAELQAEGKMPTRLVQTGFNPETGQPLMEERPLAEATMPYIVVVIDELADLMMVAGKDVEQSIARIAQKARAAGIHLLVATQRPSVDVVTGLIKANIPTRIAFSVTSKIDSRTILDSMGAEQLLGKGDMLYMANGSNQISRFHGAFVTEEECAKVAEHLKAQGKPQYIEHLTKAPATGNSAANGNGGNGSDDQDSLYQDAIALIAREQRASTSFIQRHLQIGYNRAARIIEQMEQDGFVSAPDHVGRREVVVRKPEEDEV